MADVDGFNHNNGLDTYPSKDFTRTGAWFQDTYSIAYGEKNPLQMVRVGGHRWSNIFTGATSTDGGLTWKEFPSFPANVMPLRVAMSATDPKLFVVSIRMDSQFGLLTGEALGVRFPVCLKALGVLGIGDSL